MKLPHSAQIKYVYLVQTKEKSKSQKRIHKNRVSLSLLHQILGHKSTSPLLDGDNERVWQYISIRIDPDPLCTSCQISTINNNPISKIPLKSKTPLKCLFMDIIPAAFSKSLTKDTNFSNYLLILDAYSKTPKIYGI